MAKPLIRAAPGTPFNIIEWALSLYGVWGSHCPCSPCPFSAVALPQQQLAELKLGPGSIIVPPRGQEEPPQDLLTSLMGILPPKSECSLLMGRTTCPCPKVVPIGRTAPGQESRTDPNTEVFKPILMPPCSTPEHHLCGKKGGGTELTPNIC